MGHKYIKDIFPKKCLIFYYKEFRKMGNKYSLKLFLCDDSDRNNSIAERLTLGLEEHMQNSYKFEVIILLNNPQIAIEKRIIVTPTLEIIYQGRMKRVIGEVGNVKKIIEIINQF